MADTIQPDSPTTFETIQAELEASFCPPLDTSLVAALLSELDPASPSSDAVTSLRLMLQDLASQAEESIWIDAADNPVAPDQQELEEGSQSSKSQSRGLISPSNGTGASTPTTSASSSPQPFDTPLGFLQLAFPHLSASLLQRALDQYGVLEGSSTSRNTQIDISGVVEALLSEELIREEQERGSVTTSDEAEERRSDNDWSVVERKKDPKAKARPQSLGPPLPSMSTKPKKAKPAAVPLVDTLQRQHAPPPRPQIDFVVAPDPWSHLTSLASTLAGLLPELNEGRWLALFHNPAYPTPSHAVRAELQRLSLLPQPPISPGALTSLLEILSSMPSNVQANELASRKVQDAELCLRACKGRAGDALDLVWLLEEMDAAGAAVIHSQPSVPSAPSPAPSTPLMSPAPRSPHPASRPVSRPASRPVSRPASPAPAPAPIAPKKPVANPYQWTVVGPRQPRPQEPHPLAAHIPAYRSQQELQATKKKGKPMPPIARDLEIKPPPPPPQGMSDIERCRWWAKEYRRQRDEALRAAGRHWQRGSSGKDRGGDVAMYYAEEARKLEDESRAWALRGARVQVQQQKKAHDPFTIDLHGLTLHESLTVSREGVNEWYSSSASGFAPNRSLTIITGVGKHSAGQKGVLGPAVYKALEKDGWKVNKRPGTIVVTGVART